MNARARAAAWCWIVGACAAGAPTPRTETTADAVAKRFPSAAVLVDGVAPSEPGGDWRVGDLLLFGVRLEGEGGTRDWYVALEAAGDVGGGNFSIRHAPGAEPKEPLFVGVTRGRTFTHTFTMTSGEVGTSESQGIPIAIHLYDGTGRHLTTSYVEAPERFLRGGFHAACTRFFEAFRNQAPPSSLPADAVTGLTKDAIQAMSALIAFLQTFQDAAPLEDVRRAIVDEVLDTPSLLSLVMHWGVDLRIEPHLERASPEPATWLGPLGASAYQFPTDLWVNGSLAMRYHIVAIAPDPPARVAAGVVALEGSHPRDPSRRFEVRLLASRRGAPER